MEEKTKNYLKIALGAAAYYSFAKDQFKPMKSSDRFFISPALDRAGSPMLRVFSALLAYRSLRNIGVSEDSAVGITGVGVFAIEWYLRAYKTRLVAIPKVAMSAPPPSVEPALPGPAATGWQPWDRHEEWREPWHHEHRWW